MTAEVCTGPAMTINTKVTLRFLLVVCIVSALILLTVDGQRTGASGRRSRNRNSNRNSNRNANRNSNRNATAAAANNRNNRQRGRGGNRRRGPERYGCEEIYLPMCKGLISYTHTKLPNQFNHTTQLEVYRHLETLWAYMDHSCSRNVRVMLCAKYLPQCFGRRPGKGPCKRTCMAAKRRCARPLNQQLGLDWGEQFPCAELPSARCVRPMREMRCRNEHPVCIQNEAISVCANLTFTWGTLPNMFGQCRPQEINTELSQYDALIATNCHLQLKFLLCGVYSPFCVRNEVPFTFPCKELCDEVRSACESHYRRLYNNLPWPSKLQCHRYPASDNENFECVMPNEGGTFGAGGQ